MARQEGEIVSIFIKIKENKACYETFPSALLYEANFLKLFLKTRSILLKIYGSTSHRWAGREHLQISEKLPPSWLQMIQPLSSARKFYLMAV
jgi:hypothetical protein